MSEITIIALVAGSYAATNIDNLTILVAWMLAGGDSQSSIARGFAAATVAVLLISTLLGLTSHAIPAERVGYLGVIPVGLGLWSLVSQFRGSEKGAPDSGVAGAIGIGATLTANSVDSIIVFSPLLADSHAVIDAYIAMAFVVVAALWYGMAKFVSRRAARLEIVSKIGGWLAPFIMILVGLYILMNTATDVI